MRSEHRTTSWEWDAFTRWRHFELWRPGERKRLKKISHQKDRRKANQTDWQKENDCPYGQCSHSARSHECGLCQVVLNENDFGAPSPKFCPCKYEDDDDDE